MGLYLPRPGNQDVLMCGLGLIGLLFRELRQCQIGDLIRQGLI